MKRLFLAAGLLALAGCESAPEAVPPKEAAFVTDDCALISAVGREQYKLSADDPQMTITLNGEDAPWRPGCDWTAAGFNVAEIAGPAVQTATPALNILPFHRPLTDPQRPLVLTAEKNGDPTNHDLYTRPPAPRANQAPGAGGPGALLGAGVQSPAPHCGWRRLG